MLRLYDYTENHFLVNKCAGYVVYKNVYIEHDVPAAQRAINSNFRTLLNALGESNLQLKGSRISFRQNEQDQPVSRNRDTSINRQRDNFDKHRTYNRRSDPEYERWDRTRGNYYNNRSRHTQRGDRYNY